MEDPESRVLGEYANHGFTLEHQDDHMVFLLHDGEQIAIFSQTGAIKENIQAECASHLAREHMEGGEKL